MNDSIFDIAEILEDHLDASITRAQWSSLKKGKYEGKYRSFTKTESFIPIIFGIIYLLIAVATAILVWKAGGVA